MTSEVLMIGPLPPWEMDALQNTYRIHQLWTQDDAQAFLSEHGPRLRAVITRSDIGISNDVVDQLSALELIACFGVGVDTIDVSRATGRGIKVTNTPDVLTEDVADMAIALTLSLLRRVVDGEAHVRSGAWEVRKRFELGRSLSGKRVGIFGFGRIGQAIAKRLEAFNTVVSYCDLAKNTNSSLEFVATIGQLAAKVDVLILAAAGGEQTKRVVNANVLAALGKSGWLINVARGSIVDQNALLDALAGREIAGAALDVFDEEPTIDRRFLSVPNVLLQPHQSSATIETRGAMGELVRANVSAYFQGAPLVSPVN